MYSADPGVQPVLYVPILTTILSAAFGVVLLQRFRHKPTATHLLWWGLGMWVYGTGTALAASITVFGNSVFLTKAWFIVGAVLTGYPLAQGSLYLLMPRKLALLSITPLEGHGGRIEIQAGKHPCAHALGSAARVLAHEGRLFLWIEDGETHER